MRAGGVVHSFTGSIEDAEEVLAVDARLAIGINGCSLKTEDNLDAMAAVPLDRLMLETDAPWCDCRRTHASAAHIDISRDAKDRKKHDPALLVKGRNEPCNIDQVRWWCTLFIVASVQYSVAGLSCLFASWGAQQYIRNSEHTPK